MSRARATGSGTAAGQAAGDAPPPPAPPPGGGHPPTQRELRPVARRPRLPAVRSVLALVLREMSTAYGRAPGGYLWAVVEPVAGVALLTAIFSIGLRQPSLGTSFPIFYATGLLPFLMFHDLSARLAQAINQARPLLAYPRVTFLDAMIARALLSVLTRLLIGGIVLAAILVLYDTRTAPDPPRILLAVAMTVALGVGVGTMNCLLVSLFPVWQQAWSVLTRPLVILSGVIFLHEDIPEPWRGYLWYNPLVHVTGEMRGGFYPGYPAAWVSPGYVLGLSLAATAVGLLFLRRYHHDIMEL